MLTRHLWIPAIALVTILSLATAAVAQPVLSSSATSFAHRSGLPAEALAEVLPLYRFTDVTQREAEALPGSAVAAVYSGAVVPRGADKLLPVLQKAQDSYYIYQDFEGDVWSYWDRSDNTGGQYTWGVRSCDSHSGTYSADATRGGSVGTGLSCTSACPRNVELPAAEPATSVDFQLSPGAVRKERDHEIQEQLADERLRRDRRAAQARLTPSIDAAAKADAAKSVVPVGSLWFREAYGDTYEVMGEVKNTGARTCCFVEIELFFKDSSGNLLASDWTYVNGSNLTLTSIDAETDTCLIPNETGFFNMYTTLDYSRLSTTGYKVDFDTPVTAMPDARVFLSGGLRAYNWYGDTEIRGTLKNGGTVPANFCKIHLALKRSNGAFLDVDFTYVDGVTLGGTDTGLLVGQSGSFNTYTDASYSYYSYADYKVAWDDYGQPPNCTYSIAPSSKSFSAAGGTGSTVLTVNAANCPWTAASSASWLHVSSAASGSGPAVIQFTVDANTGHSPRTGTITIAGKPLTISQEGRSCSYSISPSSANFGAVGGSRTIGVAAAAGCAWTAVSDTSWLHIDSGGLGSGSGTVAYTVDANPNWWMRSGTIAVAGKHFTVGQAASEVTANEQVYWLGGIAKAPGAGGANWQSAVMLCNFSDTPAELTLELHSNDGVATATHTLLAHASTEWADVVLQLFKLSGSVAGALKVISDTPIVVAARTANHTAGGSFGQLMPSVTAADAFTQGDRALLPHIKQNDDFRTNIGVVNLSGRGCTARVDLFDAAGDPIGSTEGATIPAESWYQFNRVFDLAGTSRCDMGYAAVEIVGLETDCTLWAYASVVDNASGDPTTIPVVITD